LQFRCKNRRNERNSASADPVDRSGRVLDHTLLFSSIGYADLDAGIDRMMRGAQLPAFRP
jgi:hypothetical protein